VALPQLDATTWQTLVPLSGNLASLDLIPAFDPVLAKASLTLEKDASCDVNLWRIVYRVEALDASASPQETLAELQVDNASQDLQFRWRTNQPVGADSLSNSWLKLDLEAKSHYLALRQPQLASPIKLEFEKERFVLPLPVESIPATDQIFVEIGALASLPNGPAFRNELNHAKLGREVMVEFRDMPGAQIGIKLAKVPQSPLGLIIEPRFKDGPSREFDLTLDQLEKTQRGSVEAVQEAKSKIPALRNNLQSAQAALRSAQNRTVSNGNQARQKVIDIKRMEGAVRDANKRLTSMLEQEATAQSRIDNVPRVLAFVRSLQGKELTFRIFVKSSVAELVLATGTIGGSK
jgi:hypothetical protein